MPSSPFTEEEKKYFPLKNIQSVVKLFEHHLARSHDDPNLSLLSIIVGAIENTLTCNNKTTAASSSSNHNESGSITISSTCLVDETDDFPPLDIHVVEALHAKFKAIIKSSVDLSFYNCKKGDYATRDLIKRVSDVIWNTLTRSYYKDRAHLQSLYSYLTGNKLDCFGVAFAVIAGCQILGFKDVHLALSEDHAWVVFGEHGQETAEVTWHGKGSEDKRGACIDAGLSANSWLYVAGHPVIGLAKGGRFTQVAALVSSINPSVSLSVDSMEVAGLQQALLWLLYDMGYLDNYPMALGNLADLEEIAPASGRLSCQYLFQQAIQVSRRVYNNCHVYPYTYQGGYYYRNRLYKEALDSWANAADVVRNYNYSREDEEIYKEFLEIANELIPHIMKVEGSGHNARSILKDPQCFAHLLRFYDGICQWEEGSSTPVLHIGWAKPLVNTISKFDADVRAQVHIIEEQEAVSEPSHESENMSFVDEELLLDTNSNVLESHIKSPCKSALRDYFARIEDKVDTRPSSVSNATLAALTELCGQTVLNASYFMGGKLASKNESSGGVLALAEDLCDIEKSPKTVESDFVGPSAAGNPTLVLHKTGAPPTRPSSESKDAPEPNSEESLTTFPAHSEGGQKEGPKLVLNSQKMRGLKDLLLSEKLNTHAISLQLTAQSQVQLGRKGRGGGEDGSVATPPPKDEKHVGASRPKRSRRE